MNSPIYRRCGAIALGLVLAMLGSRPAWGCTSDLECGPESACSGGICVLRVGCTVDANCRPGRVCVGGGCLDATPTSVGCSVTTECPPGQFCAGGICATPTPTIFITRTHSGTPTPTSTPLGPAIAIDDVVAREGTSPLTTFFDFTVTLSQRLHQTVTVHFATADGTATAGSDYVKRAGTLTFSPGVTVLPVEIGVVADAVFEHNETFVVNLSGASLGVRIADGQGQGVIQNDDPDRIGLAELTPFASVTRADDPLPVTLSWTHPVRWRDLATVDLRLRDAEGVVIWLRFDDAANTFALVDPTNATPGPGFPPGQPGQLAGAPVTVLLDASRVRADGPDAPRVDLTFTFSFAPDALGQTYTVEAAATDDSGDAQDFDAVGTILVAAALPCPGDCDGDGAVRVNELLAGVNIALDPTAFGLCPSFDADGDVAVEIGELVAAVNEALTGCP